MVNPATHQLCNLGGIFNLSELKNTNELTLLKVLVFLLPYKHGSQTVEDQKPGRCCNTPLLNAKKKKQKTFHLTYPESVLCDFRNYLEKSLSQLVGPVRVKISTAHSGSFLHVTEWRNVNSVIDKPTCHSSITISASGHLHTLFPLPAILFLPTFYLINSYSSLGLCSRVTSPRWH